MMCVVQKCARDPAGRFRGRVGRAAAETAPRRSAQHRVAPDAFVLHVMQRTADVPIFLAQKRDVLDRRRTVRKRRRVARTLLGRKLKRAREPISHAPFCMAISSAYLGDQVLRSLKKLTRPSPVFFEHC